MATATLTRNGTPRTVTQHDAAPFIAARVPFRAGNLTGHTARPWGFGRLPADWRAVLRADIEAGHVDYYVYSFATPIAWHTPAGWTIPRVGYSQITSSKHMPPVWRGIDYGRTVATRTRIDAVTVTILDRLKNSVNGNPRFRLALSDGTVALTSSDAAVSYDVENRARDGRPVYVDYTPAGRVTSWRIASADNFDAPRD